MVVVLVESCSGGAKRCLRQTTNTQRARVEESGSVSKTDDLGA